MLFALNFVGATLSDIYLRKPGSSTTLEMEQVPSSQETGERIVRGSLSLLPGAATGRGAARRSEMETWACLGLVSEASWGPMAPATRTSRQR